MTNRTINQLHMKNHLLLASGPLGKTSRQLHDYGATCGAIIGKSLDRLPRNGNPPPRISRVEPIGLINAEGGPNPGIEEFCRTVADVKAEGMETPIIGSLSLRTCRNPEDAIYMTQRMIEVGIDAVELDLKYVYNDQTGRVDYGPAEIGQIVSTLKQSVAAMPLIVKIAYSSYDMRELARVAEANGADYLSAINTVFPALHIDLKRREPVLSVEYGGLSGPAIRPLAIATVYQLYKVVNIPIMGMGGVSTGEDVVEMMMAGAETVQIFTAAMREGPACYTRIQREAEEVARKLGFSSLDDCIGAAHHRERR